MRLMANGYGLQILSLYCWADETVVTPHQERSQELLDRMRS